MADFLFRGSFVETPSLGDLQILQDYLLAVNESGYISHIAPFSSSSSRALLVETGLERLTTLPSGTIILPTFCDLHLHAPQYLYQGTGLDLPLMQWLDTYALKAEERLDSDLVLARRVYERLAMRLLESGTGTALLFGTIKQETNLILAEVMQTRGIRAFVGKLSMDLSSRPTYNEQSASKSIAAAASFVKQCHNLVSSLPEHRRLVAPVLTPRFIPTCSDELLGGLGELAEREGLRIQSHCAEARDEVEFVKKERGADDIDIFERHGLLTHRTIQAHCTFLPSSSLTHFAKKGVAIAHCPLSNVYFSSEPCRLREALEQEVKVGLGSDIAGGYSVDIMTAMRWAVGIGRLREGERQEEQRNEDAQKETGESLAINWKEALYLATRGGACALGLETGLFRVGVPFDAQLIRLFDDTSGLGVGALDFFDLEHTKDQAETSGLEITAEMVEKWWCVGDARNRNGVWVQGTRIK